MYAQPLADVDADVNVTWAPEMPQDVACQYGMAYDTSVRSSTFISEVCIHTPADTRRNNNVIMTSKRRRDVVLT